MGCLVTLSPSFSYSHHIEQRIARTGICCLFWLRTTNRNICLRTRAGLFREGGRGTACPELPGRDRTFNEDSRSMPVWPASTATMTHHVLGPQGTHSTFSSSAPDCTRLQQEPEDRITLPLHPNSCPHSSGELQETNIACFALAISQAIGSSFP